MDSLDDELIDQIFRVNWRGSFSTIRSFRKLLENSPEALIVNISSMAGKTGEEAMLPTVHPKPPWTQ